MTTRSTLLLVGLATVVAMAAALWLAGQGDSAEARGMDGSTGRGPWSAPARVDLQPDSAANLHAATTVAGREAATTLAGSLRAAGTEAALPDIPIQLGDGASTTSDALGRFVLSGLAPGRAELVLDAGPPFRPLRRTVELAAGENRLDLELEPRFELEVTVVRHAPRTAQDGQPLPGAHVQLLVPSLYEADTARRLSEEVGDAEGRCRLRDIPSGEHALVVEAGGHPPVRLLLPFRYGDRSRSHLRTGAITVAVAMSTTPLRGRVLGADRQPLAGALVCLDDRALRDPGFARRRPQTARPATPYTFTAGDGSFELPLAADESEVALLVCARREGLAAIARREVPFQHLQRELSVQVPRARPVELSILGADGRPARGHLRVSDGVLYHDLVSDPVLRAIPGFVAAYAPQADEAQASVRLSLPEGGYQVRLDAIEVPGVLGAWFVEVGADGPHELELRIDG